MMITTTENIPGRNYKVIGIVRGNCVQSKNVLKDMTQAFKSIVGGELKEYTKMVDEARTMATERMVEEAQIQNADAIVMVRYGSGAITPEASEIIAYGTAVKFID
ncbi:heavy metal-binding domain-containing protein [Methanosphaera cuniculi]|uniref:UPF0145 protein ASJ82_04475 n=2 Tax=Methanosphaera TaxID=2316 RepID=A0A2A2HBJ4_9EURY|nr:heavy metal-binding domain-containing protein [Methanosphaera cuniculi]PAV06690.1 hypothetical protein ASJ82_04475 [Methanosphaera cuniculi]PWL08802.1 hypothetical protein MSCUN_02940 [Methanosphaera cuniculi]